MKKTIRTILTVVLAAFPLVLSAQKKADPEGYVTYSLPTTTITLEVEAVQEKFYAGPYAQFAEKYLGIKVRQKDDMAYQISQVKMTPYMEADQSERYTIPVMKGGAVDASFLSLTSCGLVAFGDIDVVQESVWRFPVSSHGDFTGKGVTANLKSESTTLYRSKKNSKSSTSVQQNMVVEKTLEQRAAEAAQMIVKLREQRLKILTGDTDATYSGEAMGAAIEELTRLEEEYMTLFAGYSEHQEQSMKFEVIPEAGRENHLYVAFRISDSAGLVPADNLSGRPVVLEIIPQEIMVPEVETLVKVKTPLAYYRIPAVCTLKLKEGNQLLLQERFPIYQLGRLSSMPVNTVLK